RIKRRPSDASWIVVVERLHPPASVGFPEELAEFGHYAHRGCRIDTGCPCKPHVHGDIRPDDHIGTAPASQQHNRAAARQHAAARYYVGHRESGIAKISDRFVRRIDETTRALIR